MSNEKILVTGATGFIGCRIVEILHLSKKHPVKAAIHQWSSAARLGRFPVEITVMDLMDKQAIADAMNDITIVIHCAKGPGDVTVQGTENLLQVALDRKVKHFIHLSTTEVYGNAEGTITEDQPFEYTGNTYNQTKIDAEKKCRAYHEKGLPVTILRPSIVYGPFSKNWTLHFANMFLAGEWSLMENVGEGKCNLIYVDDLVKAIFTVLLNEKAFEQAFNVVGPDVVTWNEYFKKFNAAMGLPELPAKSAAQVRVKNIFMVPLRQAGKVVKNYFMNPVKKISESVPAAKKIMKKAEHALKINPVNYELKLFNRRAIYDNQKIIHNLNFEPKYDIEKGLNNTVKWLIHHGVM